MDAFNNFIKRQSNQSAVLFKLGINKSPERQNQTDRSIFYFILSCLKCKKSFYQKHGQTHGTFQCNPLQLCCPKSVVCVYFDSLLKVLLEVAVVSSSRNCQIWPETFAPGHAQFIVLFAVLKATVISLYLRLLTLNTAQYLQMKFLRFALTQILPNFICLAFSFNISEKWSCFHLRGKAVVASHTPGFQGHKKPIRSIAILTLYYEIQPERPLLSSFCIFVRVSQFSYAPSKHLTARSRLKTLQNEFNCPRAERLFSSPLQTAVCRNMS